MTSATMPIQCRIPLKGAICLTLAVTTAIIEAANDVQGPDTLRQNRTWCFALISGSSISGLQEEDGQ